jgi:hypothetical protein
MRDLAEVDVIKQRDFGMVISDLILFIRQNIGAFLNLYLRYGLSVMVGGFILSLLFSNSNFGGMDLFGVANPMMTGSVIIIVIAYVIASFLFTVSLYAYTQAYIGSGRADAMSTYNSRMGNVALKVFLAYVLVFGLYILVVVFFVLLFSMSIALGVVGVLLFIPLMLYLWVYMSLFPYTITLPAMTLGHAVQQVFAVVKGKWWWTFGIMFIILLIGSVIVNMFSLPIFMIMGFGDLMAITDPEAAGSTMTFTIMYFLMYSGSLVFSGFYAILQPLLYHSLHEEKYGSKLEKKIEEVKPKKESFFENEGEF